jgi:hypothetical protein
VGASRTRRFPQWCFSSSGAAATKYAMPASLGNLPVVYMTALNGWAHDRYGTAAMLVVEALAALVWVILGLAVLARPKRRSNDKCGMNAER